MTQNRLTKAEVLARADQLDFPSSVVEFFQGYLGQPVGGFPEDLRSKIIRNKPRINERPGATLPPIDFKKVKADLRREFGKHITDSDVVSWVMYPKVCSVPWCIMVVRLIPGMSARSSKNINASFRDLEI